MARAAFERGAQIGRNEDGNARFVDVRSAANDVHARKLRARLAREDASMRALALSAVSGVISLMHAIRDPAKTTVHVVPMIASSALTPVSSRSSRHASAPGKQLPTSWSR